MWHSIACNSIISVSILKLQIINELCGTPSHATELYQLNVQQSSGQSKRDQRDQITDKIHQRNEEISAVSILKLQIINELCGTSSLATQLYQLNVSYHHTGL